MSRGPVIEHRGMRLALSTPVVLLLVYLLLTGGVARPLVSLALLTVGVLLAVTTVLWAGGPREVPAWWQAVATGVGVGLLPVLLVAGLNTDVELFSLLFLLVLLVGAFTYPRRVRLPLLAWTLGSWLVALWWGGLTAPDLLPLHVGAGLIITYSVMSTADALERAVQGAAASAESAERRAGLLSRMLQVHSLDREDVLQTVVEGLEEVGFAAASVRVVVDDRLELAAGLGLHRPLAPALGIEEQLPGHVLHSGRVMVIEDPDELAALEVEPEARAAIGLPVEAAGTAIAVVTAITIDGPILGYQREAIELLAALAGRALQRAQDYEADEHTVVELQQLQARAQDFVSTVSHELRTPLTVVQGLGRTLSERWDELEPQRRHDLLRRVDANAGRLAEMVRSLLDTSALEEGRLTPDLVPVELGELVAGVLHRLAGVTAAHPVTGHIPADLWVWADRSLLGNVLENLLTNTARHTPQGTRIEVSAEVVDDGRVEVVVADDGPGIPVEDLPHVVDRFYRGGDPTLRPAGGLGLGLALANQILVAHDSHLEVSSEPGQGARFAFRLARPRVAGDGEVGLAVVS